MLSNINDNFKYLQAKETQTKVDHLKKDNKQLEDKITVLGHEMQFLKEVFIAHAAAKNSGAAAGGAAAEVYIHMQPYILPQVLRYL